MDMRSIKSLVDGLKILYKEEYHQSFGPNIYI